MSSYDFVTADKFGKNGWPFFWPHVLEFGSCLTISGLDLTPWPKVDHATLAGWRIYMCEDNELLKDSLFAANFGHDPSITGNSKGRNNLQRISQSVVELHQRSLVPTAIAVVRRTEDRHHVPIVAPVVTLRTKQETTWTFDGNCKRPGIYLDTLSGGGRPMSAVRSVCLCWNL